MKIIWSSISLSINKVSLHHSSACLLTVHVSSAQQWPEHCHQEPTGPTGPKYWPHSSEGVAKWLSQHVQRPWATEDHQEEGRVETELSRWAQKAGVHGLSGLPQRTYEVMVMLWVRDGEGMNQGRESGWGLASRSWVNVEGGVDRICSGVETGVEWREQSGLTPRFWPEPAEAWNFL